MATFFAYSNAIRGTQSTINGAPVNYAFTPSGTWRYAGPTQQFVVTENDGAQVFNGDGDVNERVDVNERIGGAWQQTTQIDGSAQQVIWDYTFTVTDGTSVWRIGVIDVDLNNDDDLDDTGEDGYYLVFPDGPPPANTDLSTGGIVENDDSTAHGDLGGTVVCFAAGMLIDTPIGPHKVEDLAPGDLVLTGTGQPEPIRWTGATTVPARGELAPIVISQGTLGNEADLIVSPQHGILLTDWRAMLYFGEEEVLVRAVDLLHLRGVYRREGTQNTPTVRYHHLLLDAHHVVRSGGIWSETLYPGVMTLKTVSAAARREIARLFPDLANYGPKAASFVRGQEARILAA